MIDPRKSYWSEMPLLIKVCAPLTVFLFLVGASTYSRGYDEGMILIGLPLLVMGARLALWMWLEVGPQSIIGYTYDYWTERAEVAYKLPRGTITIVLVILFFGIALIYAHFGR